VDEDDDDVDEDNDAVEEEVDVRETLGEADVDMAFVVPC
jgi:hypothetical protein